MRYRFSHKTYRRPLARPLRTAHGNWTEREGLVLRLEDENGRAGFGEVAPIPWLGTETLAAAEAACASLGATVADEVLDAVPARLGCVRFALAQARSEPAAPVAATRLPVAALLPAGIAALAALREKLAAGFLVFKWKVGVGALDDELGLLDEILGGMPAHTKLRLDANGGWSRREAAHWLDRCAGRPIEFVEQPVAPVDEDALRGLAEDFPVTLALDESVLHLTDARRWQGLGWPGVFVVKPALAGPLAEVAAWIVATKADVVFSSAIETALGRSAILRLALQPGQTARALGFGVDGIFGDRCWDGPHLGPVADVSGIAPDAGAEIWSALN